MRDFTSTTRRRLLALAIAMLTLWSLRAAEAEYIGVATMLPDGTIHLRLRAPLPGGGAGEGEIDYKPDSPDYQQILEHLGGLQPGETKPVNPWPDEPH